jgi:hypothetical protein
MHPLEVIAKKLFSEKNYKSLKFNVLGAICHQGKFAFLKSA